MTAINRCALTYKLLLEVTSTEHHRWRDWFAEHPKAWGMPFATGRMATISGVVLHIFAVAILYTIPGAGEPKRKRWLTGMVVSGLIIIAISAYLRWISLQ